MQHPPTASLTEKPGSNTSRLYVRIEGMYCPHCEAILTSALQKVDGVSTVRFLGHVAEITPRSQTVIAPAAIINAIHAAGYETRFNWISDHPPRNWMRHAVFLAAVVGIVAIGWILRHAFGVDLLGTIPSVGGDATLAALFVAGLMTSLHCAGMCGALLLGGVLGTRSAAPASRTWPGALLYNAARIVSYAATGATVGALGAVFAPGPAFRGAIQLLAGVAMLLVALRMAGLVNVNLPPLPSFLRHAQRAPDLPAAAGRASSPLARAALLGLVTGLMPCGPLQAMQLWALGSGSAVRGALGMLAFGLGTVPLLFAFGTASAALARRKAVIARLAAALLTVLAAGMILRGLRAWGVDPAPGVAAFDCCEVVNQEKANPNEGEAESPAAEESPFLSLEPGPDGFVAVPLQRIGERALYVNLAREGAPTVQLIALRDASGQARIAFNTCQACSPSPRAFFTQRADGRIVCGQCGNVFGPESVGANAHGCNPAAIPGIRRTDNAILVPAAAIEAARPAFARWAGPLR